MNNGIPVLGSNRGAIPELVNHGKNGFIFNPDDPDSLTKLIENLISDNNVLSTLSKNAIDSSREHSLEKQLNMTLKVFSSLT